MRHTQMFNFIHYSGFNGSVSVPVKKAADIMGVTLKTAKTYLKHPEKADKCRMAWLEAVACRRVIPANWEVWVDGDTFYTNSGYEFNRRELESIGWLRGHYLSQQEENKKIVLDQKIEIDRLNARLAKLEQSQKKAVKLPDNVIAFKPR